MPKLITENIANLNQSAINTINTNFDAVDTAIENTLSRDGSAPNAMGADLDMNGFRILNLPTPVQPTDPVRLQDVGLVGGGGGGGGAGVTDGDKGDIVVSSAGGVWTIDSGVVSYSKIQDVSVASKLLGRGSGGGSGDVEEITLGTNLSMSGTTINATDTVATPGGSNQQVQFNNSSAFGGDAGLVYDPDTNILTLNNCPIIASDAGFDVLMGWDDSLTRYKNMLLADIATEGAPTTGDFVLLYGAEGDLRKVNWNSLPGAGGGLANISDDTDPALGGNLDANTFNIQFDDNTGIRDDSGNEQLIFQKTASAVNHIEITNAATAADPIIAAAGDNANIDLVLQGKGSGGVIATFTGSGLTIGSSVPFSDSSGTLTLQNVDVIDSTTESTIETAIDTLTNLSSIQGRTITLADAGADRLFAWDDSENQYKNMALGDLTTEAAPADGDFFVVYGAEGDLRKVDWASLPEAGGSSDVVAQAVSNTGIAVNSTTDVTIVSDSAGTVAVGDQIDFDVWFIDQNNSGANRTHTFTIEFGSLTATDLSYTIPTSGSLERLVRIQATCTVSATNLAVLGAIMHPQVNTSANNGVQFDTAGSEVMIFNFTSSDITGAMTVALKVRSGSATATQTLTLLGYTIRKRAAV